MYNNLDNIFSLYINFIKIRISLKYPKPGIYQIKAMALIRVQSKLNLTDSGAALI